MNNAATGVATTPSVSTPEETEIRPLETDIICGRGGGGRSHPGTQAYRNLVKRNQARYSICPEREKRMISVSIVQTLRNDNRRFLSKEKASDKWYDIGDEEAIRKVSQALREGQPQRRRDTLNTDPTPVPTPSTTIPPATNTITTNNNTAAAPVQGPTSNNATELSKTTTTKNLSPYRSTGSGLKTQPEFHPPLPLDETVEPPLGQQQCTVRSSSITTATAVASMIYKPSKDDKSDIQAVVDNSNQIMNNNNILDSGRFNTNESILSTDFGLINLNNDLNENDVLGPDGTGLINFGDDDGNKNQQQTEIPLQPMEYQPTATPHDITYQPPSSYPTNTNPVSTSSYSPAEYYLTEMPRSLSASMNDILLQNLSDPSLGIYAQQQSQLHRICSGNGVEDVSDIAFVKPLMTNLLSQQMIRSEQDVHASDPLPEFPLDNLETFHAMTTGLGIPNVDFPIVLDYWASAANFTVESRMSTDSFKQQLNNMEINTVANSEQFNESWRNNDPINQNNNAVPPDIAIGGPPFAANKAPHVQPFRSGSQSTELHIAPDFTHSTISIMSNPSSLDVINESNRYHLNESPVQQQPHHHYNANFPQQPTTMVSDNTGAYNPTPQQHYPEAHQNHSFRTIFARMKRSRPQSGTTSVADEKAARYGSISDQLQPSSSSDFSTQEIVDPGYGNSGHSFATSYSQLLQDSNFSYKGSSNDNDILHEEDEDGTENNGYFDNNNDEEAPPERELVRENARRSVVHTI